jgi:hypothetical protein
VARGLANDPQPGCEKSGTSSQSDRKLISLWRATGQLPNHLHASSSELAGDRFRSVAASLSMTARRLAWLTRVSGAPCSISWKLSSASNRLPDGLAWLPKTDPRRARIAQRKLNGR